MESSTELELLRFILQQQGIEYVVCDRDWRIEAYSPGFPLLVGSQQSLLGRCPGEIFDEFEGVAAELEAVAQRAVAQFQIPHICHECSDGSLVYLTFTAVAAERGGLLLIITDTTQEVQLMQRLMQERNEVILLQQRLEAANGREGGAPDSAPRSEGTEKGIFRQDSQDYQD
ncbi:MAG: PAS domain-containing protein [Anaerolineae bacterium]|jgi:hypothetical protein|nr:PAS domain-containing protein [Anaerolineae bacterium]